MKIPEGEQQLVLSSNKGVLDGGGVEREIQ